MNTEETQNFEPEKINDFTLRDELVRLSAAKEIKYSEKYIKKANQSALEKIKQEYQRNQMDTVNSQLTENLIEKFSNLMEQLKMVENDGTLDKELSSNKLLFNDVKTLIQKVSPYIPMIGLISGGLIVAKHMWTNKTESENKDEPKVQNDENLSTSNDSDGAVDTNNDRVDTN